jgi:YkoP domain
VTEPVLFDASPAASAALSGAVAGSGAGSEAAEPQPRLPPAHRLIRWLDAALRQFHEVREFSKRSDCLLRVSVGRADRYMRLADGTHLSRGVPVADLHLWNEQLPAPGGSTLARTNVLRRRMLTSLGELARYIDADPSMAGVVAVRGRILCLEANQVGAFRHLAEAAGFELIEIGNYGSLGRRLHDFLANFLLWALAWTFNPSAARGKGLRQSRCELWVSRGAFLARHARHSAWTAAAHSGGTEGSPGALKGRQEW